MERYQETFETWNKVAKLYEDKFMNLDLYNDTYDEFCSLLFNREPTVLEIGCGPGNITKYLLSKRPDFKIEAIDVSENMIMLARINNPSVNFNQLDCRKIDKIKNKFDGIVCGFCLPYLSEHDCKKLIKDFTAITSESAIIYLSFVEGESNESGYQVGNNGDRVFFYYHQTDNLKSILNKNGFTLINLFHKSYVKNDHSNELHTILIAKKSAC